MSAMALDVRYREVTDFVVRRFARHLGPRLQAAFVKGSVVRGDALWGVSDLDLVLAFESPTAADTALKNEVEAAARALPAGDVLVIQRIGTDRLLQLDAGTRAYWLYSCYYDAATVFGPSPAAFLPVPPRGHELVRLIAPIIRADGEALVEKRILERRESRRLAKRILHALALPALSEGYTDYVVPLAVPALPLPSPVHAVLKAVTTTYATAPRVADATALQHAWHVAWEYSSGYAP